MSSCVPLKVNTNIIDGISDFKILRFLIGNIMWGEYVLENEGSSVHTLLYNVCTHRVPVTLNKQ